jgi:ABC-type glycerol-3-phosphate transport system substrate-binding protein
MKSLLRQHWGVIFLSCAALASIASQAFFTTPKKEGVVDVFFADRMTDAHHILIDRYNRLHEGKIRVVPIDFPNEEFTTNERKEVFTRLLRGQGEGMDVFAVDRIWVQRFERWCQPLDPYFRPEELDHLTSAGLRSCYKGGSLVAVPFFNVMEALVYRHDLLQSLPGGPEFEKRLQAGITWNEFLDFGARTRYPGPYYIYPAAEYEGLICSFTSILLGIDPGYFEKHGFDFDQKEARRALQLLVDLVNRYRVTPKEATTMTEVTSYGLYARRNGLFVFGWTNVRKDFGDSLGGPERIRMAAPPRFSDGHSAATIGGWSLMLARNSTKLDQSIDFIKFLLTPESQEVLLTRGGSSPVLKVFFEDTSYVRRYPELADIKHLQEMGVHRPFDERYTRYSEILASYFSQAIRMKISVPEALRQASAQIRAEGAPATTQYVSLP